MALQSPGVEVTVIDESFYTPAEPGTTPLIVVATAQDKTNGSGTGVASATTKANAGKAFKLTSQRDLVDLYGVPFFEKTASSSPVHGSERNEYGLLAAYSLLGVSNAAFIVRADVDLNQLQGQTEAPGANPADGKWWVDTQSTAWGVQEWNGANAATVGGQKFANKVPTVFTADDISKLEDDGTWGWRPKSSNGVDGDYALVFLTGDADKELAKLFFKVPNVAGTAFLTGEWVLVGSEEWTRSWPAVASPVSVTLDTSKTFYINNNPITAANLTSVVSQINTFLGASQGIWAREANKKLYLYTEGKYDGDSSTSNVIFLEDGTGSWETDLGGITEGEHHGPRLELAPHTQVPRFKSTDVAPRPTGSVWIKTTTPNLGADWLVYRWSSATASWNEQSAFLYNSTSAANFNLDRAGGGSNIPANTLFVQYGASEWDGEDPNFAPRAEFRLWRRSQAGATVVTSPAKTTGFTSGIKTFTLTESVAGVLAENSVEISTDSLTSAVDDIVDNLEKIATAINNAKFNEIAGVGLKHVVASYNETTRTFTLTHTAGGEIKVTDTSGLFASFFGLAYNVYTKAGTVNFYAAPEGATGYDFLLSAWRPLASEDFVASADAPTNEPADGQLWYNPNFAEVDIMVHNGNTWVGYGHSTAFPNTRSEGPIVAASNPWTGTTQTGDLWISTADLENYPTIYRYNSDIDGVPSSEKWELVDKTDQTSEEGILFADARYGTSGPTGNTEASIQDLLTSNYLDFDAPDPALYPRGMLLWNTRRSGGNVKRYVNSYIDPTERNARYRSTEADAGDAFVEGEPQSGYVSADGKQVDRWVTASPNNEDGSGSFGRKAQRSVVVAALKAAVDTSEEIRDEERRNFNLIAAPGYPELMSNLVNLNIDRGITAFVIGDTPLRLRSDATTLTNWGSNANLALDNGDNGIVTYDEYLGVFYPNGFTTDLTGANAVVPASHMMLRTIALSDNVSYPWFAPAGTRRGGITNATAAGYIDALTGEFQSVALNEGQRDTLYDQKINPITFFNGIGLVNYGQKTRARNASALDRINVARLTVYLRSQLNKLARPYIFEPNDKITRDEIKQAVESLLLELVGLRALYDFAVVCDESNNTNARIDRNELWVDIAIEPVKAVEFIYIPLRVKNTGEI
jgi:hypothetical protein